MVTPTPDIQYVYNASITWDWARQVVNLDKTTKYNASLGKIFQGKLGKMRVVKLLTI